MIKRGEEEYESARVERFFNLRRPEKYPDSIVFPKSKIESE